MSALPPTADAPAPAARPGTGRQRSAKVFWSQFRYIATGNPVTLIAFSLFLMIVILALFGPMIVPFDPLQSDAANALKPPSWKHWFGTDNVGRDVFSRVIVATRLDLLVGRMVDTIMAFPLFVLAMGIVAAAGNTVENIVYATAIINLPFYARVSRAEVNIRRNSGYVLAAKLAGNSDMRVMALHVFPNALPPMMVQVSLNMGWAILNAAGLSFIGLGVQPPTAEWGIMVAEGANYIVSGEWWMAIFPGAALMLAVFTFNLMGDGLRDLVDPQRRT